MALELKQQVALRQQLVMTPQLQQAIKLLQLSTIELQAAVEQELVENPCLEEVADDSQTDAPDGPEPEAGTDEGSADAQAEADAAEEQQAGDEALLQEAAALDAEAETPEPTAEDVVSDVDWDAYMESSPHTSLAHGQDDRPALEDNLVPPLSLADHLLWQLSFADLDDTDSEIAALVIGNLDEKGYLAEELEGIAEHVGVPLDRVAKVLERVQTFDPVGVAARNLTECLMIQARHAQVGNPLVFKIIEHHLEPLQRRDYKGIARLEDVSVEEVSLAAEVVASFEPRPGGEFSDEDPIYITPDIYVHKIGDEYHVVLNEDGMPRLRVSQAYRAVLNAREGESRETKDYVREKLRSAVWLIKSIHQRQRTIGKVMESIIRFQREFFDKGTQFLRPLNLRDVADDIEMHESTVSRVTTAKYVQTPHGIFELKFFFNSSIQTSDGDAIASESVKEKIRALIRVEDARKPLSDQKIAELLRQQENITIARRTVTKYREAMRILSSTRRRQFS